jgi:hypothetical protein
MISHAETLVRWEVLGMVAVFGMWCRDVLVRAPMFLPDPKNVVLQNQPFPLSLLTMQP